jgi:hypothetical protein
MQLSLPPFFGGKGGMFSFLLFANRGYGTIAGKSAFREVLVRRERTP